MYTSFRLRTYFDCLSNPLRQLFFESFLTLVLADETKVYEANMKAVAPVDRVNYDALAAAILSTSAGTRYSPSFFYMGVV